MSQGDPRGPASPSGVGKTPLPGSGRAPAPFSGSEGPPRSRFGDAARSGTGDAPPAGPAKPPTDGHGDAKRRREIAEHALRAPARGFGLRRFVVASIALHVLMTVAAVVLAQPRYKIPEPIPVIPVELVQIPAPAPKEEVETEPIRPVPDVVPDPLKKPPRRKPPPPPPEKKEEPKKKETPKPVKQPQKPKVEEKKGTTDPTPVVRTELPTVGDAKATVQMQVEGPILEYAYYLRIIQEKIASYWEPPPVQDLRGREMSAVVRFRIELDGRVPHLFIEEPSGMSVFDLAAQRAVERAAPLPPLPQEYSGEFLVIHLRFVLTE